MERIKKAHMECALKTLNAIKPMENADFALEYAYGGVRLVKRYRETGGETDITVRGSAREIYNIMCAIEAYERA